MDVEKSSKNASESAKLCGVKEREKGGFCFQKYSKDEISEFFMVWFTHPPISKFQRFRNLEENFDILGSFFLVYTVASHTL